MRIKTIKIMMVLLVLLSVLVLTAGCSYIQNIRSLYSGKADEEVIIADSRSLTSYEARHIVGAISMPLLEVDERYKELPQEAKIVFYCT